MAVARADGGAHAGTDEQRVLVHLIGPGQRVDDPVCQLRDIGAVAAIFHHHGKFVAAQPPAQLIVAHDAAQPLGNLAEQPVAHRVPQRIVDRLEPVQIDHQKTAARPPFVGFGHGMAQRFGQLKTVGQPGKRIEPGQMGYLFLALLFGRDIGADTAETHETAVLPDTRRGGQLPP